MERYDYISGHFCVLLVLLCCSVRLGSVCCLKRYSPLKEKSVTSACIERALVSKKAWIVGSSSTLGRKELYDWILVHSYCTNPMVCTAKKNLHKTIQPSTNW